MTQPEDDAARLARELASIAMGAVNAARYVELQRPGAPEVQESMRAGIAYALLQRLRAHLAERDARERMVREAAEEAATLLADLNEEVQIISDLWEEKAYKTEAKLRAALSAKSDEQTEETNG